MVSVFRNVGEKSMAKNYCPVSLFSVVIKVFKKLLNDQLKKYGRLCDFLCCFRSS